MDTHADLMDIDIDTNVSEIGAVDNVNLPFTWVIKSLLTAHIDMSERRYNPIYKATRLRLYGGRQ
jgi:hypothetical protein